MTIRRQYSLPNCTLILEGLSDTTFTIGQPDPRAVMSILVNAECHFSGHSTPVTGGREFLESLVTAVSSYAQEFLSGVPHPIGDRDKPALVQLNKGPLEHLHRLTVQPSSVPDAVPAGAPAQQHSAMPSPTQIDLTTVQLFDLVEAVDQFLADSRTMPNISLQLTPVSKRYAAAKEPVARRAAPAAVGVTSLAVAAGALFLAPVPRKVEPPKDPTPQTQSTKTPTPVPSGLQPRNPQPPKASIAPTPSPKATATPKNPQPPKASTTPTASPKATATPKNPTP